MLLGWHIEQIPPQTGWGLPCLKMEHLWPLCHQKVILSLYVLPVCLGKKCRRLCMFWTRKQKQKQNNNNRKNITAGAIAKVAKGRDGKTDVISTQMKQHSQNNVVFIPDTVPGYMNVYQHIFSSVRQCRSLSPVRLTCQ